MPGQHRLQRAIELTGCPARIPAGVLLALLGDPDLLLLDELTSGLDPLVQAEFTILRELLETGGAHARVVSWFPSAGR